MTRQTLFVFLLTNFFFWGGTIDNVAQDSPTPQPLNPNKTLQTIAFGSCNNQDKPQTIWTHILANKPDLWIWLGDNIYGDTENMQVLAGKYAKQKNNKAYQQFRAKCPIIGIWDDHDYGVNDGYRNYPQRAASKKLLFDFLDVPKTQKAQAREGAYQTYTFGPKGKQVRVILLDTRYFRDKLEKAPRSDAQRYSPNHTGTILGEAQWQWLEQTLAESTSDIHLIASSIQIIPTEQGFEKWANFPNERRRLLGLLSKICPANPILLSGDRHMAEVSEIRIDGYPKPIREITSSGLTHTWTRFRSENNPSRVGEQVVKRNFAILHIDWNNTPSFSVEIRSDENTLLQRLVWTHQ